MTHIKKQEKETAELGYYEVQVTFQEEATITLVAPSEEAAAEIVLQQYQDQLKEFNITSIEFKKSVEPREGNLIQ